MIDNFSNFILRFRIFFISLIFLLTLYMAYQGQFVRYNYNFSQTVPDSDEDMIFYKNFKKIFGEDGNVFAIGLKDSSIFDLKVFNNYNKYVQSLESIEGVNGVLSLSNLKVLKKDTKNKNFKFENLYSSFPETQNELDSLIILSKRQKFYENKIFNDNGAITLLITIDKLILNSFDRNAL